MAESHVVSALVSKRAEIAGLIAAKMCADKAVKSQFASGSS